MTTPDAEPVSHPPECVCTPIGHDGNVWLAGPTRSGPPPIWINAACPVHGGLAAAPAPDGMRQQVETILREQIYLQHIGDDVRVVGYGQATDAILDLLTKGKGRE